MYEYRVKLRICGDVEDVKNVFEESNDINLFIPELVPNYTL